MEAVSCLYREERIIKSPKLTQLNNRGINTEIQVLRQLNSAPLIRERTDEFNGKKRNTKSEKRKFPKFSSSLKVFSFFAPFSAD